MAIRFPSLDYLLSQTKAAFLRFPLTILSATLGVVIAIYLIETGTELFNRFPYINAMLCAALGIPLYFCVALFAERHQFSSHKRIYAHLLATAVLVAIYFGLPDADSTHNTAQPYIRYAVYNIIVHLLVSFAPFLLVKQLNGFWNYNKTLFLRLLMALLYSGFLFVGLALALLALRLLFDLELEEEIFAELFVIIFGLFNTWFFIAAIPEDFGALEENTLYPRGLKVFAQYVLLPLLLLYLLILYAYGLKIVFSWDWPRGIVSYLIMCVSVLGILTLLLIYPYALQGKNRWIKKASKIYYLLLVPLLVLLFLAIGMRLADYGITINRYIIVAIGIWLSIICVYFLTGRNNIKFVPVSLATLLLLISVGPWGMFAVSERSQVKRLEAVLSSGKLLDSGSIAGEVIWIKDSLPNFYAPTPYQNEGQLSDSLHNEVMSIVNYLDDYHGFQSIQPWFRQNLDSLITVAEADTSQDRWSRPEEARIYVQSLGIPYEFKNVGRNGINEYVQYTSSAGEALEVSGYDKIVFLEQLYQDYSEWLESDKRLQQYKRTVEAEGVAYHICYAPALTDALTIITKGDTLNFPLDSLIENLTSKYAADKDRRVPMKELSLQLQQNSRTYKLVLEWISFYKEADSLRLTNANGLLMIRENE